MAEVIQSHEDAEVIVSPSKPLPFHSCEPSRATSPGAQHDSSGETNVIGVSNESAKPSRRSKFTSDEDLILIREVAACKAHSASNGKKGELFAKAAACANQNPGLKQKVTQKSIQDRYVRLQKDFDEGDKKESAMSGIGGEVGEMVELLSEMRQAREDKEAVKCQEKAETTALEAKKEEIGAMLVNKSLHRRAPGPSSGSISEAGTQNKVGKGNGKRKRESFDVGGLMMSFSEAIKESELLRSDVENRKLELKEKRLRIETEERGKDREERKAEREAQTQLDLDKFRLMMESQASMMKKIVKTIKRDP